MSFPILFHLPYSDYYSSFPRVLIQFSHPMRMFIICCFKKCCCFFMLQQQHPAVNTFGGLPASVNNLANSALILLMIIIPPTVEPGETGVSSPSILIIESPTGAPLSKTRSAKSESFFPSFLLLVALFQMFFGYSATTLFLFAEIILPFQSEQYCIHWMK